MICRVKVSTIRYIIHLDKKTTVSVNQEMLFTKDRWLVYFGSFDAIQEFIDNYNKKK